MTTIKFNSLPLTDKAPVLDQFFDWIDSSIYHALIVFGFMVVSIGSVLLYLKFKEN